MQKKCTFVVPLSQEKNQNMSKISLHLDQRRKAKASLFPLVLRLTHNSETRLIPMNFSLSEDQWNPIKFEIKKTEYAKRDTAFIHGKLALAKTLLFENDRKFSSMHINKVKEILENSILNEVNDSDEALSQIGPSTYLSIFGKIISDRILEAGKYKTAAWYKDAVSSIIKFNKDKDIYLSEIDVTFVENYKAYCLKNGQSKNSISARLRALRALMNKAKKEGSAYLSKDHKPFEDISIPNQKTPKRAISKEIINLIRTADIKSDTMFWNDRNYFLFMFNLQGMNFIDLAKLQCKQISHGRLRYIRSKTNKPFDVKLTKEAEDILSYYILNKSPEDFIFPIIKNGDIKDSVRISRTSEQALHVFNKHMKKLATELGIEEKITSYVIRHSWASAARKLGISTDIIGDGLGHNNYSTTEIYLQDFENDVVDEANAKVTGV